MKFRPSLFPFALFALIWGTALAGGAHAATYMLIDGLAAATSSPNIVHPGVLWMQSFDSMAAVDASGPLAERTGGKRSNRAKYGPGGSPAAARPAGQLAFGASPSFVSIAATGAGGFVRTAATLTDRAPAIEATQAATAAQPDAEDDPPSAYLMLAAGLSALALVAWRRATSL